MQAPSQQSRVVSSSPVYYGWVVLLAATFGMFMTTPGQNLGVSIFLDRIIAELGLSRATVSLMYTFGPLLFALGTDWLGGYAPILVFSALPPLLVALTAPFLKPLRTDSSII